MHLTFFLSLVNFFARALPSFSSTPHSLRLVPPHPPTNIRYRSVASGYVLWTIYSPPCMCIPIVAKRKTCPPLLIRLGGGKTGIYTHPRRRCEDRAARCSCHGALMKLKGVASLLQQLQEGREGSSTGWRQRWRKVKCFHTRTTVFNKLSCPAILCWPTVIDYYLVEEALKKRQRHWHRH